MRTITLSLLAAGIGMAMPKLLGSVGESLLQVVQGVIPQLAQVILAVMLKPVVHGGPHHPHDGPRQHPGPQVTLRAVAGTG